MTKEDAINLIANMNSDKYTAREAVALTMAIKALEQKWIPVSERLPEADVDVLVTDNGGGVPTVIIDACGMKDATGERFWYISQTPVAWMEWPEPYMTESEEI